MGTGIVLPIGAGYVFHAWWKTAHDKKGRNVLLFWFGALMVLEPIILVPWGVAQLRSVALASVVTPGFWEVAWITVVMMSPFVMTAAVVNGLALQKIAKVQHNGDSEHPMQQKIEHKPTTWQELLKQHPDMVKMTGAQVAELTGGIIKERQGVNWIRSAKEYVGGNGNHA